jgi:hypothetical protein
LELCPADLNLTVGDDASSREDLMKIRVAVTDAAGAHGLLVSRSSFDRPSISVDRLLEDRSARLDPRVDGKADARRRRGERVTILNAEGVKR